MRQSGSQIRQANDLHIDTERLLAVLSAQRECFFEMLSGKKKLSHLARNVSQSLVRKQQLHFVIRAQCPLKQFFSNLVGRLTLESYKVVDP